MQPNAEQTSGEGKPNMVRMPHSRKKSVTVQLPEQHTWNAASHEKLLTRKPTPFNNGLSAIIQESGVLDDWDPSKESDSFEDLHPMSISPPQTTTITSSQSSLHSSVSIPQQRQDDSNGNSTSSNGHGYNDPSCDHPMTSHSDNNINSNSDTQTSQN